MQHPINEAEALARMDGDRETFCGLAEIFIERKPELIATIESAVARQDSNALHQATHKLIGTLATFYAAAAIATAELLQHDGDSHNWSIAEQRHELLCNQMDEVVEALGDLG